MEEPSTLNSFHLEFCRLLKWNPSWSSTVGSSVVASIASPVAILLNAILIVAVVNKKKLRSICNILLASMAVADLLIGAVAQPLFFIAGIFRLLEDYETMCALVLAGFFAMYLQSASIYHLAVLSCERYIAIKKGINYKFIVTKRRLVVCIIIMWVLTALSVAPTVPYVAGIINKKTRNVANACLFTIPLTCCVAATAYFYIMIYLESRKKNENTVNSLNVQAAIANMEKKIAKTAFLLTMALLASFAPTFVLIFLTYLFGFNNRDAYLWAVTLNQLNSCLSPVLYFYRSRRFRNTVLQMLNIKKPQTDEAPPKAGRKEKPRNNNNANSNGDALQKAASNRTGTKAAGKSKLAKAKSKSWGPTMFMEMEEAPRPKTALMRSHTGAAPKEEVRSFNQANRRLRKTKRGEFTTMGTVSTSTSHLTPTEIGVRSVNQVNRLTGETKRRVFTALGTDSTSTCRLDVQPPVVNGATPKKEDCSTCPENRRSWTTKRREFTTAGIVSTGTSELEMHLTPVEIIQFP